jgi:hypothetical protein
MDDEDAVAADFAAGLRQPVVANPRPVQTPRRTTESSSRNSGGRTPGTAYDLPGWARSKVAGVKESRNSPRTGRAAEPSPASAPNATPNKRLVKQSATPSKVKSTREQQQDRPASRNSPRPPRAKKDDGKTPDASDSGETDHDETPVRPVFTSNAYDRELVDMLHREILQLKPNVHWADIAGILVDK